MKVIDTRIETMQLEIIHASNQLSNSESSFGYNNFLLLDALGNRNTIYPNPRELLSDKGGLIGNAIFDDGIPECDGSKFLRVSVVVDVLSRDDDEPRFSSCDRDEVKDALLNHRAMKEQEANREGDGFTRIEGAPIKMKNVVYHNAKTEKPDYHKVVVAFTRRSGWFLGKYTEGGWIFEDGTHYNEEQRGDEVVVWFKMPDLINI